MIFSPRNERHFYNSISTLTSHTIFGLIYLLSH
jgi:hypothetical protein